MPVDPPSHELQSALKSLGIDAARWQSCQSLAADLGGGLPVVDCLWIDALNMRGLLTPWQARQLEAGCSRDLLVRDDQWVVTHARWLDPQCSVFEVVHRETRQPALLTRIPLESHAVPALQGRIRQLINTCEPLRSVLPALPMEVGSSATQLEVVSGIARGEPLNRLLVRRGRFPEPVVRAIAMDLAQQLALAETRGGHGDVRLSNIWMSGDGQPTLINWGVLPAVWPALSLHTPLPVDAPDTCAPERLIGERRGSGTVDQYALGCCLWQLLAGRPPFLVADPLLKLQSHQLKAVRDVREFAPDTSESLALLIQKLTARDPQQRPTHFSEVLSALKSGRTSRRTLQEFTRTLPAAQPMRSRSKSISGAAFATTAAVLLSLTAVWLAWNRDSLGLPQLSNAGAAITPLEQNPQPPAQKDNDLLPLPTADAQGVVLLSQGVRYAAGNLASESTLVLRGDRSSTIVVRDAPLTLSGERILLEGVTIIREQSSAPTPLVSISAQELRLQHCRVTGADDPCNLIEWTAKHAEDPQAGRLLVVDTILRNGASAVTVHSPLTTALWENVRTENVNVVADFARGARAGLDVPWLLNRCTLRSNGPVLRVHAQPTSSAGRLTLQGSGAVVEPAKDSPLVEFIGAETLPAWESRWQVQADGLVFPEGRSLATWRVNPTANPQPLEESRFRVEGLIAGQFHFEPAPRQAEVSRLVVDFLPVHPAGQLGAAE